MTTTPPTGYRTVQHGHDIARWRQRLFSEVRKSPKYRGLVDAARSAHGPVPARPGSFAEPGYWLDDESPRSPTYADALEQALRALRLTHNGQPCPWAIAFFHDDVEGRFDPEKPPRAMSRPVHRVVEIVASPASLRVTVRTPGTLTSPPPGMPNPLTGRIVGAVGEERGPLPETPMQISGQDWDELERRAVEAARKAVQDLKTSYKPANNDLGFYDRRRFKAGNEPAGAIAIEKLAALLAGRSGNRRAIKTERDWCRRLGIDIPRVT